LYRLRVNHDRSRTDGRSLNVRYTPRGARIIFRPRKDEFLIRNNAVEIISEAGFDIVEAENADEAISFLERRLDITVVFTDINMPGSMDGLKLAAAIRGRWPPIQIVATSGLRKIGKDELPPGSRFLPNPYSPS
jgi:CheY-like chemotaxis protein